MTEQQSTDDFDVITREEFQNLHADRTEKEVFGGEEKAEHTALLIQQFVASYGQNKDRVPLEDWLASEFGKFPMLWLDADDLKNTARDVVTSVQRANEEKVSLYAHLDKGKSKESWLAKRIEAGAKTAGAATVGQYAQGIDRAIQIANDGMRRTILNKSGEISRALNLDGFVAEQHHVDTFNLEAVSQGSPARGRVLTPEGGIYSKNSMDIGIYDGNGKLARRYQVKYGQDADNTRILFDRGDYRGQRKVVPEGHADHIKGAQESIEYEGVKSKPLSKEKAKELQENAQLKQDIRQYEWNEVNRINIAKSIGKQALIGAGIVAGMQGLRILGRRVWNTIRDKENPPASEDLREFFASSIKSGKDVGVQVAVSGAMVVAVKNGWLGALLRGTPAGAIANAVYVGMENAKILYKLGNGELTGVEALDAMGLVTCSTVGALGGAGLGLTQGAMIGMVLGPVGAVIGGFVGGVVGGMAGSKIGEAVYEGGKALVKTAASVLKTAARGVREAASVMARALNPLNWVA